MPKRKCPISYLTKILGQKWTLELIYYLRQRRRFGELQELVGGINPTTLSQRLKFLQQAGIINRIEVSTMPPHVEYDLTHKGRDLTPILNAMHTWVKQWHPDQLVDSHCDESYE